MSDSSNLFARPDTFLGVCQAVGDDLGFNPDWLRVVIALPLLWMPLWSAGAYVALTIVVVASRLLFPARRSPAPETIASPEIANDEAAPPELARAA